MSTAFPKRINRKQLAQLAGVSPAVITAVMQNRVSTIAVGKETRERVLRLAEEHRYRPDIAGRSLVSKRSYLLGVVFSEVMSHFMWETVAGLEAVAAAHDYSLLVFSVPASQEEEAIRLHRALDRKVDALACLPVLDAESQPNHALYGRVVESGTPIVQLYTDILEGVPSVRVDERGAAQKATQYLIDLGHQRILHFTREDSLDQQHPGRFRSARLRREGYTLAMERAGLKPIVMEVEADRSQTVQGCARSADAVVRHPSRPTAVFCYSDGRAVGLMNGLHRMGKSIPEEISVLGFDNTTFSEYSYPALSTIGPSRIAMGHKAGEMLLQALEGKAPASQSLPSELYLRESTASL